MTPNTFDPITQDPPRDPNHPATMASFTFPSEGQHLLGNILIAAGAGPHPTILLLHGFPGNEKSFDLAHVLRRAGWNVCVFRYRGSWGSEGDFRFSHTLVDTCAALDFFCQDASRKAYRIDTDNIIVIGHSMGGFTALITAMSDVRVRAVASIAGVNFGMMAESIADNAAAIAEAEQMFGSDLAPLRGVIGPQIVADLLAHQAAWELCVRAVELRAKPVLLIAGSEDMDIPPMWHHDPLVDALEAAGATQLTAMLFETDHMFSDKRIALARVILDWLQSL